MKKVLLVLSLLSLVSCSVDTTDCNCGTILSVNNDVSGNPKIMVVSDCEEDPRAHSGEIYSYEWTFVEISAVEYVEEGDAYCSDSTHFEILFQD